MESIAVPYLECQDEVLRNTSQPPLLDLDPLKVFYCSYYRYCLKKGIVFPLKLSFSQWFAKLIHSPEDFMGNPKTVILPLMNGVHSKRPDNTRVCPYCACVYTQLPAMDPIYGLISVQSESVARPRPRTVVYGQIYI